MEENILEKLAELEHDQWCDWAGALSGEIEDLINVIAKLEEDSSSDLSQEDISIIENSKSRLVRWKGLMVPYSELSEDMKESDRVYARKILSVLNEK